MFNIPRPAISIYFLFCLLLSSVARAEESQFVRLSKDDQGRAATFDTAITSYRKGNDVVDTIAVVHIGEASYYKTLSERFKGYDALLYELIAEPDDLIRKQAGSEKSSITKLQESVKSLLGLEFQLDHIDYTQPNFVHADMTPEALLVSMQKKNESFLKMLLKLLLNSSEMSGSAAKLSPEILMLQLLLSPNRQMVLRRTLAKQFQDMEVFIEVFEGEEGSSIITERNKVALSVLKKEMSRGKHKLAIFYGAGHMPHFEESLTAEGFEKQSKEWVPAWKLR